MILVSDSHVSTQNKNDDEFFEMLLSFERFEDDVVFLGDIFDLWVSLPRYQEEIQERFLKWCARMAKTRQIGLVEGNHEFFVAEREGHCFSWVSGDEYDWQGLRFVHGDCINEKDVGYLRFRKLTKNPVTKTIVRYLPFGTKLVHQLKEGLKDGNKDFRYNIPYGRLDEYAEETFSLGIHGVLVGHFHEEYRYQRKDGSFLQILPDWLSSGKVGHYAEGQMKIIHWREIDAEKSSN